MPDKSADKPKIGRPATGQMPKRIFRMADDEWETVTAAAEAAGDKNTSAYLRRVVLKDATRVLRNAAKAGG